MKFRAVGTKLGSKVSLGTATRIDRPWTVEIGPRTTTESDVWIKSESDDAEIQIGSHCFLGRGCEIDVTERVTIGNRVLIGPHSFITDHNHQLNGIGPISLQGCESNPVSIGDDVWIGTGATILPGVKVGTGAVIAAGAVVTHDVDDLDIVGGVPARHIRSRRDADLASDNTEVEQNQEAK